MKALAYRACQCTIPLCGRNCNKRTICKDVTCQATASHCVTAGITSSVPNSGEPEATRVMEHWTVWAQSGWDCNQLLTDICWTQGTESGAARSTLLRMLRSGGCLEHARSVIVYTAFQAQAHDAAQFLHTHGVPAAAYHAGRSQEVRGMGKSLLLHPSGSSHKAAISHQLAFAASSYCWKFESSTWPVRLGCTV